MNNRIHEEMKEFDALKQYLQNEKIILPFFNLQEINNVLQAEVSAELKPRVSTNDQRRPQLQAFLKHVGCLSERVQGAVSVCGCYQWSYESRGHEIIRRLAS